MSLELIDSTDTYKGRGRKSQNKNHNIIVINRNKSNHYFDESITNCWDDAEKYIRTLIKDMNNRIWIYKFTQTGFTFTTIQECVKQHKTVLVICPTNRILTKTVKKVAKKFNIDAGIIGNNQTMCVSPNKMKNPILATYHAPCRTCRFKEKDEMRCNYHKVVSKKFQIYGITYDKLQNIYDGFASNGFVNDELKNIIENVDVILLDEFPRLLLKQPLSIDLRDVITLKDLLIDLKLDEEEQSKNIDQDDIIYLKFFNKMRSQNGIIEQTEIQSKEENLIIKLLKHIKNRADELEKLDVQHLSFFNEIKIGLMKASRQGISVYIEFYDKIFRYVERAYEKLNKDKIETNKDIKELIEGFLHTLKALVQIITYDEISILKIVEYDPNTNKNKSAIKIIPNQANIYYDYIIPLHKKFKGKIIATGIINIDSILLDKTIPWDYRLYEDHCKTESMHIIVADTRKHSKKYEYLDEKEKDTYINCKMLLDAFDLLGKNVLFSTYNMTLWKDYRDKLKQMTNDRNDIVIYLDIEDNQDEKNEQKLDIIENEDLSKRNIDYIKIWAKRREEDDENKDDEKPIYNIRITYARSSLMAGGTREYAPIKFFFNTPETPKWAMFALAFQIGEKKGYSIEQIENFSQTLREYEIVEAFINSLGRGKDPNGKIPSITLVLRSTIDIIRKYLEKGSKYPEHFNLTRVFTNGKMPYVYQLYIWVWFTLKGQNDQGIVIPRKLIDIDELSKLIDIIRIITMRDNKITSIKDIRDYTNYKLDRQTIEHLMTKYSYFEGLDLIPEYIERYGLDSWCVNTKKLRLDSIQNKLYMMLKEMETFVKDV